MTIAQGITIKSTTTPELNGTYALDRARVTAVAAFIAAHGAFPSGLPTLEWADIDGQAHKFTSPSQFMAFATAVIDLLLSLEAGNTPAQTADLP